MTRMNWIHVALVVLLALLALVAIRLHGAAAPIAALS
jgi:hypothetical protein